MLKKISIILIIFSFVFLACTNTNQDKTIEHEEIEIFKEEKTSQEVKIDNLQVIYIKTHKEKPILFTSYILDEKLYELNMEYDGEKEITPGDIINVKGEFGYEKNEYDSKELGTEYIVNFFTKEIEIIDKK